MNITKKDIDKSLLKEVDIGIFKNSDRIITGVNHLIDIKPFPINTNTIKHNLDYQELFKNQIQDEELKKWIESQKKYVLNFIKNDKKKYNSKLEIFKQIYEDIEILNDIFNRNTTNYPRYIDYYNNDIQKKFLNIKFTNGINLINFMEFQKFIMNSPPTTEDMYLYRWVSNVNSDVCSNSKQKKFDRNFLQFGQSHNFLSTTWSPYFGANRLQSMFISDKQPTVLRIFIPKGSHVILLPTKEESTFNSIIGTKFWVKYNELEVMLPMFSYLYKKPCTNIPVENTITYGGPFNSIHKITTDLSVKMIDCCFSNTLTPEYEMRIIESYILDPTVENFFNLPYYTKSKIISSIPKDNKLYKTVHQQFEEYKKNVNNNNFLKKFFSIYKKT